MIIGPWKERCIARGNRTSKGTILSTRKSIHPLEPISNLATKSKASKNAPHLTNHSSPRNQDKTHQSNVVGFSHRLRSLQGPPHILTNQSTSLSTGLLRNGQGEDVCVSLLNNAAMLQKLTPKGTLPMGVLNSNHLIKHKMRNFRSEVSRLSTVINHKESLVGIIGQKKNRNLKKKDRANKQKQQLEKIECMKQMYLQKTKSHNVNLGER